MRHERTEPATGARSQWGVRAVWATGLAGITLILGLRLDHVCGLYVDDGWYVLLAKALAGGQGYTLASVPTPGILPSYPPGFPFVLSLVFRVAPRFPENVPVLKAVSIAALLGTAVLTRRYCLRDVGLTPALAVGIALATALHPGLTFLATSTVMSECVFTFVQLAVVVLVERVVRERGGTTIALLAGLVGGFAFLVRSLGLALVVAAGAYLAKERRWRAAAAFVLGALVVAGPWVLHARLHAPTLAEQADVNDQVVYPYDVQFWMNVAGNPLSGTTSPSGLPGRMWKTTLAIGHHAAGALEVYPLYHLLDPGKWAAAPPGTTAVSLLSCVSILIGFVAAVRRRVGLAELLLPVTLAFVALWPAVPFRFLLPLLPFVLCHTVLGVRVLVQVVTGRDGWGIPLATVILLATVSLVSNVAYVRELHGPPEQRPAFVQIFDGLLEVVGWARDHVPAGQPVAAIHPALVSLYSGHQAVGFAQPAGTWATWRRLGIHYLVDTSYFGSPDELREGRFTTVYRSPTLQLRVLDLRRIYEPH